MKQIPLNRYKKGKNSGIYFVQIDDEDYNYCNQFNWSVLKCEHTNYAVRHNKEHDVIFLHRELMGCIKGDKKIIDHKNHNGLDCQKVNLRICTHTQNGQNRKSSKNSSSKYLGVDLNKSGIYSYWRAGIRVNKKLINLGHFKTEHDAAISYNKAALMYFGEFANLNIINRSNDNIKYIASEYKDYSVACYFEGNFKFIKSNMTEAGKITNCMPSTVSRCVKRNSIRSNSGWLFKKNIKNNPKTINYIKYTK